MWQRWKRIWRKVGNLQARILLTIFYATLMLPFGVAVRLFFDPLRVKRRPTRWLDYASDEPQDLNVARRQ
jgi:hypothetical protein